MPEVRTDLVQALASLPPWHRWPRASVLDAACGEGYGSYLLRMTPLVTGVDVAADAIAHATERYAQANLQFTIAQ